MIKKITRTIEKNHLLEDNDTVIVALSGGADSVALLLCLVELAGDYRLKMIAAHFNHGLRKTQSDQDEILCRDLVKQYGLKFVTGRMQDPIVPKGLSPEDYFRRERYRFLNQIAANYKANKIALGHHRQDQAETVLLNFLRGCGLDGLKGMPPMRDNIYIRPLIDVSRREIYDFIKKAGIDYCQDSSNENTAYMRNHIRKVLIPFLQKQYNPKIETGIARMAEIIRRDDEFINGHVRNVLQSPQIIREENSLSFSAVYFSTLHAAVAYRLIKDLLESLTPQKQGISLKHIQSLVDLVKGVSGKKLSLPQGMCAKKEYDRVVVYSGPQENAKEYEYILNIPGEVDVKERHMILEARHASVGEIDLTRVDKIYMDADKIKGPLSVRNRRKGDWFIPLGTKGKQKLKKFFIDRKIPRDSRDKIALIADRESVVWIENMHLNERVKVGAETENILMLDIRKTAF